MVAALAVGAAAQEPVPTAKLPTNAVPDKNQVYGGFQWQITDFEGDPWSKYFGFNANYTRTIFNKHFGVVADFDYARNNGSNVKDLDRGTGHNSDDYGFRFGPRYNILVNRRFQPFVVALFGGAHFTTLIPYPQRTSPLVQKDWFGFSYALGGGLDYRINHHWGVRGQWDHVHEPWGTENTDAADWDRITIGATYRW